MKKILLIFTLLSFLFSTANAQMGPGHSPKRRIKLYKSKPSFNINLAGYIGTGFGQENLISLPKFGGLALFNFGKKPKHSQNWVTGNLIYTGVEGSMIVFFAGAFNIGATAGIKLGPITLGNSYSALNLVSPSGITVAKQQTYNPKIGLILGPVWLKFGPSFITKGENILGSIMKKKFNFNIEVNFLARN